MKILVATEKPFAPVAVQGIREVIEGAGHELVLVEKGTREDMINAIADCAGLIMSWRVPFSTSTNSWPAPSITSRMP